MRIQILTKNQREKLRLVDVVPLVIGSMSACFGMLAIHMSCRLKLQLCWQHEHLLCRRSGIHMSCHLKLQMSWQHWFSCVGSLEFTHELQLEVADVLAA